MNNIFVLPRSALQPNEQIYVVGNDNRLQFRDVTILRSVDENIYITDGIRPGELLCLSPVNNAVPGMLVQPVTETALVATS